MVINHGNIIIIIIIIEHLIKKFIQRPSHSVAINTSTSRAEPAERPTRRASCGGSRSAQEITRRSDNGRSWRSEAPGEASGHGKAMGKAIQKWRIYQENARKIANLPGKC